MEALDFGTVRERVAGYARFHLARRRALDMSPAYTPEEVNALQAETSEGLAFLAHGADVSLHADDDPTPLVERAALEGVLPVGEAAAPVSRPMKSSTRERTFWSLP